MNKNVLTQEEFDKLAKSHGEWLQSEEKEGKRLEIKNTDLSKLDFGKGYWYDKATFDECDFSGMTLQACFFQNANFINCDFSNAIINYCTFLKADFNKVSFKNASIYASTFASSRIFDFDATGAKIIDCDFESATMLQANFRKSILKGSTFLCASLDEINFYDTDFSGVKSISTIDYMKEQFEKGYSEGYYGYKLFNVFRKAPSYWILEKDHIISETVNYDRSLTNGSGIHIGNLNYIKTLFQLNPGLKGQKIWKVYIAPEWLPGVVVPFKSKGIIRCERCALVKEYTYEELFGKEEE